PSPRQAGAPRFAPGPPRSTRGSLPPPPAVGPPRRAMVIASPADSRPRALRPREPPLGGLPRSASGVLYSVRERNAEVLGPHPLLLDCATPSRFKKLGFSNGPGDVKSPRVRQTRLSAHVTSHGMLRLI